MNELFTFNTAVLPDRHVAPRVPPQNVVQAVAVEVARELDRPLARHVGDERSALRTPVL
jgi:hypothetical protein